MCAARPRLAFGSHSLLDESTFAIVLHALLFHCNVFVLLQLVVSFLAFLDVDAFDGVPKHRLLNDGREVKLPVRFVPMFEVDEP